MPTRLALADLLSGLEASVEGSSEIEVSGVAYDSRQVVPGDIFVAVRGFVHDGTRFAGEALRNGAVAVVAERGPDAAPPELDGRPWVRVDDARVALARLACRFWGDPSHEMTVVGVTGTNGKTTVAALLEAVLSQQAPAGRWSTTAVRIGGELSAPRRTTPEAPDLQRALRRMVDAGCRAAAIEVSSHALALHRVAGTRFTAATFTNLTADHLDFHRDADDYLGAKARLFADLPDGAVAVLNADEAAAGRLAEVTESSGARVASYGWTERAQRAAWPTGRPSFPLSDAGCTLRPGYLIDRWERRDDRSLLVLDVPDGRLELDTPLFGPANAENVAAAAATALELGIDPEAVRRGVAGYAGDPGRFQAVEAGQPFAILVDYAHTPAALEVALAAARSLAGDARVLAVFGCGGDRDTRKRPLMGRVAAEAADRVILTSDNPRSEDPEAILDAIETGVPAGRAGRVERLSDRRAAIRRALDLAAPGDCVLIAGKGHETEQVLAGGTVPFDDAEVARRWAQERASGEATGSGSGESSPPTNHRESGGGG